ncbi:MAG TPA: hypothetical protein VLS96_00210 [Nodosilinea sp.]|nr:hypothetical protein [Nodosilinea sp.]
MTIRAIAARLQRLLCVGLATLVVGSGLLFGFSAPAAALGNKAGDIVQSRAERELDRVSGSGTANQLEGRAKEDLGRVQRQVDKMTGDTDGLGNQVQGRAQKDIGRAQGAVENAAESAQDSAEGLVDSVKNFFGQ